MLKPTRIRKMPPRDTINFYMSRLKNLRKEQLVEAMRLHGKGDLNEFGRSRLLELAISQRMVIFNRDYPNNIAVASACATPSPSVIKAFYIILDMLNHQMRVEVTGINEFYGIDAVNQDNNTLMQIVPLPAGNFTTQIILQQKHMDQISYVYMIDDPSQIKNIRPLTPQDTACYVHNLHQKRLWEVKYYDLKTDNR